MMLKKVIALALFGGAMGFAVPSPSRSSVDLTGAWWTVEARDASGKDITDRGQRTMFVFTRRHFAIAWSALNRPQFAPPLSDSQKVAMWQDFGAQAGTYDLTGDTLTLHSDIAKTPRAMTRDAFQKYSVQRDGDRVWLQLVADNSGRLRNQERVRLERAE